LAAAAGAAGAVVAAGAAGATGFAASAGLLSAGLEAGTPGVHASSSGIAANTPSDNSTVRRVIFRSVILDAISIASS
jgi:hypothetical protein